MAVLETTALMDQAIPAATDTSRVVVASPRKAIGTFQCLVVSTQSSRRAMLEQAATDGGWETIVCQESATAWSAVKRQRFQLALVDLDGTETLDELKELSEEVSEMKNTLLVLCGNEGVALEEIWARQLGAWLYLPGVTEGSDIASLCEQAQPIAEKFLGKQMAGAS